MDWGNMERIGLQPNANSLGLVFLVLAALVALLFAGWVLYMLWNGLKMLFRRKPVPAKIQENFDEAKAMENLEVLLASGTMDEAIKAAYATPEAQARIKAFEEVGRIVRGEKKGRCALDPP